MRLASRRHMAFFVPRTRGTTEGAGENTPGAPRIAYLS